MRKEEMGAFFTVFSGISSSKKQTRATRAGRTLS
jgi:hypothetical protein